MSVKNASVLNRTIKHKIPRYCEKIIKQSIFYQVKKVDIPILIILIAIL